MNTEIKVVSVTAQKITFDVSRPESFTSGNSNSYLTSHETVEMPLADAAKIIDAINKYADISIATKALAEFID